MDPITKGQFLIFDLALRRSSSLSVLLYCCAFATGCAESEQEEAQSNLRSLAAYYNQYRAQHRGQAPADEQNFKDFIAKSGSTNVESLFISNRDGKPYVVKYRGDKSWMHRQLIAFEQEGRDGSKEVATVVGGYEKLSEEEFRKQMTPAAAK
ncbi:MAG TPA: hypothetical protein VGK58_10990 [Lacipirellulaceae bacterium]